MAGLGRKEFNSGDILLASEVQGYLQDQAVMVFDDATARGSAIPSPSEGMLTYNKDTDQLELYDGSAFGPVGSDSGLIHIETQNFSGVSSLSINNVFSSTYRHYQMLLDFTTSLNADMTFRYRVGGSDNSTSNYSNQFFLANNTSLVGERFAVTTSGRISGGAESTRNVINFLFANPAESLFTSANGLSHFRYGGTGNQFIGEASSFTATTVFDGFTILCSTGNFTGSISIFGYAKA